MRFFFCLIIIFLVTACDPWKFGFKKNPAYVLEKAFKAIQHLDEQDFLSISGKEALCLYGNSEGLSFLRSHITLKEEDSDIKPNLISSKYYKLPNYVGYWSYYQEIYRIDISEISSGEVVLQTLIECDYGTNEKKDSSMINLKPSKYPKKECRLTKVIPKKFSGLSLSPRCSMLKVRLEPL